MVRVAASWPVLFSSISELVGEFAAGVIRFELSTVQIVRVASLAPSRSTFSTLPCRRSGELGT